MAETVDLIARARQGDLDAFGALVRRFGDMVHGYACSRLGDFHLAEDVAQEVFLEAHRSLGRLREPAAFAGWLRRIVVKHCDRQTRRRRPAVGLAEAGGAAAAELPGPQRVAERGELRERVLREVAALPAPDRTATALFYIDGYSQEAVAEFLGVSTDWVKNRLRSSRQRLRERMGDLVADTLKSCALPGGFAETVVRMVASEEDLKSAGRILADSYHGRRRPEALASLAGARENRLYVVEEDGRTVSAGWLDLTEIGIGGTILRAVRPREFAGESRGVPDPVFAKSVAGAFKLAREKGVNLAVVHGSTYDHAFCGFVPCFHYAVSTLSCAAAAGLRTAAKVRKARSGEAEAGRRAFLADGLAPKMSAYIGGGAPHVVELGGQAIGHLLVDRKFEAAEHFGMHFGYVTEVAVPDREAALAVLKLAARLAAADGQREVCLPYSDRTVIGRTMLELGGSCLLRPSCDLPGLDAEMAAILDLAGLSRELSTEFELRARGAAPAALSLDMDGQTAGFELKAGRLTVDGRKRAVHRRLPRWVLTRLYMGYCSGEEVLGMAGIPWDRGDGKTPDEPALDMRRLELPEAEAGLFRALFPAMLPTATPDPDVWPWVLGRPHPRYQNEKVKSPAMKAEIDALRLPWLRPSPVGSASSSGADGRSR